MRRLKRAIGRSAIIGRAIRMFFRARTAIGYYRQPLTNLLIWLVKSKESSNYTYDLKPSNVDYLASLIADILSIEFYEAMSYIKELEEDSKLRMHIADEISNSDYSFMADETVRYGRRIGWYAITRAIKPETVIETGVDKGLGACVLATALKRNREEGYKGRYLGTDINPSAGQLLSGDYTDFGHVIYGDSIESLKSFDGTIDLFINDSDHSAEYEAEEYETIRYKLSPSAIILGDNSHVSNKLLEFSLQTNRQFVFFQEKPLDHWYPGAGIGISFKR